MIIKYLSRHYIITGGYINILKNGAGNKMSKKWYDKYKKKYETQAFRSWWVSFYGNPKDYSDMDKEQDEYWIRKGFALEGYIAGESGL